MTSGTVLKTRFSFVPNNRNYTNAMVTMVSWPAYNQPNGLIISHLVMLDASVMLRFCDARFCKALRLHIILLVKLLFDLWLLLTLGSWLLDLLESFFFGR